jgi:hypothetical protein
MREAYFDAILGLLRAHSRLLSGEESEPSRFGPLLTVHPAALSGNDDEFFGAQLV